MVEHIEQEFRVNQKDKTLSFPNDLLNLPRRGEGYQMSNSSSCDVKVPYEDAQLDENNIETDDLTVYVAPNRDLTTKPPKDYDPKAELKFVKNMKVADGTYTGTVRGGLPNGYG